MHSSNTSSPGTFTDDANCGPRAVISAGFPPHTGTGDGLSEQSIPGYRLFDTTSMGIAAFFGSPVAGTALMAINYRRLGRPRQAVLTFAAGITGTAAAVSISEFLGSPSYMGTVGAVTLFTITYQIAKTLQGPAIERHIQQGGKLSSRWAALGLSILVSAALFTVVFSGALAYLVSSAVATEIRSTVPIGTKDSIILSGTATKEEALKLGEALKQTGYLTNRGVTVLLNKDTNSTAIGFVVHYGVWDQPEMISSFEEIGREIAPAVGGFPIKVRLVDAAKNVKREMNVGRVVVGAKDELYYYGSASQEDANALAWSLKNDGFLSDHGVDVFLSKGNGSTSLAFVVADDAWGNPNTVALLETLVRNAAPFIGGLPIELRLENNKLQTQKVEMVN